MAPKAGDYEGQAVEGTVQYGETGNGSLQIALNLELFDAEKKSVGQMTTFLYFTEGAAVYSYERLRLLGWQGQGPDDIDKLGNIYKNRVPCRVTAPEQYRDPKDGTTKTGTAKLEIVTSSTVQLAKPLDVNTFKARLKTIGGSGGSSAAGNGGGAAPPPF